MILTKKPAGLYSNMCTTAIRIFLLFFVLSATAFVANAQSGNLTFSFKNVPLQQVINEVAKKSGYEFVFDAAYLKGATPTTLEIKSASINEVLDAVLKNQNFSYQINKKIIVLKPKNVTQEQAPGYIVKGRVIDSVGQSMPGVIVRVRGTDRTLQTDERGAFAIEASIRNPTLQFSYIGYDQKEYQSTSSVAGNSISIVLNASPSMLKEVFVNGYQSISNERQAAAYTIVDNKKLNEQINTSLLSALEGRVAGLMYQKNPNGSSADKPVLRGIGTYSSSVGTDPLLVIDGLPTQGVLEDINPYDVESVTVLKDAAAASIYGSRAANGVIVITTKKGEGSAIKISLNADLMITERPDLSSLHLASTSQLIDYQTDVYNAERARYASSDAMFAYYGDVANGTIRYFSPLYQLYRQQEKGSLNTDQVNATLGQWRQNDYMREYTEQVWQNEVRKRYNVSLGADGKKSNNYVSLNYDEGIGRIKYNKNKNFLLNFKSSFDLKPWLRATIGFNGRYSTDEVTDGSYGNYNIQQRYERILDENGNRVISDFVGIDGVAGGVINPSVANSLKTLPGFKSTGFNVLDELAQGIAQEKNISLRTFANLQAKLYKGLRYNVQFQYETGRLERTRYDDVDSYKMRMGANALTGYNTTTKAYTYGLPIGGRFYQFNSQSSSYTFRNQLSYDASFGEAGNEHAIAAIGGFEMRESFSPRSLEDQRYGYDPITLTGGLYNAFELSQTGAASYIYGGTRTLGQLARAQTEVKHRYISAYSNMSYTFRSKYILTGSIRIDQADLFGTDPKYQYRPLWSVGLGWNASNEEFLKDLSWLNHLKVRGTYGINGNVDQTSNPYLTARRRNDNLYPSLQYIDIVGLPNPKLRWERTTTTNFGVDFALLNSRVRGAIDMYNKYSDDLIVSTDLDPTVGASSRSLNNGALRNQGVEFTVNSDWYKSGDWTLTSGFVLGFNKNKIKKVNIAAATAYSYVTSPTNYFIQDDSFNSVYAYKYGGMTNGYPYFLDQNGESNVVFDANGVPTSVKDITSKDALVNMGTLIPTYSGSFSQRIAYKSFEFGALFVFSGGNKLRKDVTSLSSYDVTDMDITERWKAGSTSELPRQYVDYPEPLRNYASTLSNLWRLADKQVVDADYIKLRNVSLSYRLPSKICRAINISSARLTGQVNNLWYYSVAGDDIDPEVYSLNNGSRNVSSPKTFLLGVSVNF